MPEFGITEDGFVRKRLDDILADKNAEVTEVFGPDINLAPQTVDGQINGVLAESDANLWELTQAAYDSFNPDAATGVQLSNLVQLNGITRLAASSSTVSLDVTGTLSTVIPAGSLVGTVSGIQYATDAAATITANPTAVAASAVIPGATQSLAGTILEIINPVTGWSTVTNPLAATVGRDLEKDAELRIRRAGSVANPSQSLLDSIFSAISDLEGIIEVIVLENDTGSVDVNGQPGHSIQAIVEGGDDTEIASAIFFEKAAGIQTVGDVTIPINDIQGLPHDINFRRPTDLPIYLIINLTIDGTYPANGADTIKQATLDFAEVNINIGDDVLQSRLFTPVNTVPGHTIDTLFLGVAPVPTLEDDIVVPFNNIARFTLANIEINETFA